MKELKDLSAVEIGRMVKSGEVRPTEVLDYFFERIHDLNPKLNAFVYTREEEAYEQARILEQKLQSGCIVGPFAGVPFALKDFLSSKQFWTNTHGGVKCLETVDRYSSEFCIAMERAGGIAIGKTNAPAFGFRGTTDNKLYGPTHNPYDHTRNAGGSSGGSAAAVAAGLVPIAEGGDAGGSIRIPAAWCGCYGFKASVGTIPNVCRPDAWAATHPYCTPGGLTKNVEDAAVLLSCMARYDSRDPLSRFPGRSYSIPKPDVKGCKVAVTEDFGLFGEVDPEIWQAVQKVAKQLEEGGAKVSLLPFPVISKPYDLDEVVELWCKAIMVDSAMEMQYTKMKDLFAGHQDDVTDEVWEYLTKAGNLKTRDFYEINKVRTDIFDDIENVFSVHDFDIILSPVTTCLPLENSSIKGETKGPNGDLIGFAETFLYNFTGNPAASCPVGFSKDGLPLAVQVAGRRHYSGERDVLMVSQFIENMNKAEF